MSKPKPQLQSTRSYEFGPFRLNPAERVLLRDGQSVPLTPKSFDILLAFVRNSGHLLEKEELIKTVWENVFVEESNLTFNISVLRKALGENKANPRFIETVPKRGYRFIADVREVPDERTELERQPSSINSEEAQEPSSQDESAQRHELDNAGLATGISSPAISESDKEIDARVEEVQSAHSTTSAQALRPVKRRKKAAVVVVAMLIATVFSIIFVFSKLVRHNDPSPVLSMSAVKLTNTGKAVVAAISPNGQYVVHVVQEAGQQSLWVKQVATSSNVRVMPPAAVHYVGLTFSHDSNYLYYIKWEKNASPVLHHMPVLGGAAKKLVVDVHSPITLSPDGKRLAFTRHDSGQGESALIVANADGTAEQKLAVRVRPNDFGWPAWSPDGKTIACSVTSVEGGLHMNVVAVAVEDKAESLISAQKSWALCGQVQWLRDGSGLLMTAANGRLEPSQVWHLAYPSGEAHRITNDANTYHALSLTHDSRTLITLQSDQVVNIWTAMPYATNSRPTQITFGRNDGAHGLSWMPDGRIVYGSSASGNPEIWIMEADGSNQKQLTAGTGANYLPSASPDGRYIVFASDRAGVYNIWRTEADGSNPMQLTNGKFDAEPDCSPDSQWVYYASWSGQKPTLWRVSIKGGEAVQITDRYAKLPTVSPNGKLLTYFQWDEQISLQWRAAVAPLEGEGTTEMFGISPPAVRWTPDGRSLSYIESRGGVSNIWSRALTREPAKQLTDFTADEVFHFAWSQDGQRLACTRGVSFNDVVMLSDFR